jgi:hypothetical protein
MPRRYCATAAIKWASLGVFSALSELPEISTQMPTASMVSALVRAPAHQAGAFAFQRASARMFLRQTCYLWKVLPFQSYF